MSTHDDVAEPGVCYRHPDRPSWVLCQRCGRTICPECQIPAAVGVQCPECVREGRASMQRRPVAAVRAFRSNSTPVVTYSLIGVTVAVYLLQLATGGRLTNAWVYVPALTLIEPWRMVTAMFLHAPLGSAISLLHILFNMYALYVVGPALEHTLGRWRFLALYLISGFAGSVGVLVLAPLGVTVLGASGAVFGLFGAFFIVQRHLGASATQIAILIVVNLALGFFAPQISWQGHVGGLVGGALVALVYTRTRARRQRALQVVLVIGVVALLAAAGAVRIAAYAAG